MSYMLLPPIYRTEHDAFTLTQAGISHYADAHMEVLMKTRTMGVGREELRVCWTNQTQEALRVQLCLTVRAMFRFTHYVIPGVSLNGNPWGRGQEPKGLMHDGEPCVFDARRTSIPACTVSESHEEYLTIMASDEDDVSHRASCSMEADSDGRMLHRLYYPLMERPLTYCTRDGYAPAHDDWLTPASGQTITAVAYVLAGKPLFPSFSMANVEDAALTLFLPQPCFSRF